MTAGRPLRPGEKSRYPLREMSSRQRSRLEQRKVLFGLSLALAVVLVYSLVLSRNGVRRYAVLSTTLTERSDEAYQRIVRNRQLSEEIASLQNDDRALEELARTRLGVVGRDEVVFVFPEDEAQGVREKP
jgi:cell division protein FtsB